MKTLFPVIKKKFKYPQYKENFIFLNQIEEFYEMDELWNFLFDLKFKIFNFNDLN